MEILNKYKDIITRIEEMCTSTAAMAPYPVGATSMTTYRYGKSRSKGNKEGKMPTPRKAIIEELVKQRKGNQKNKIMLNYKYQKTRGSKKMDISEMMNEIANICEAIIDEAVLTTPEIRARVERQQEIAKKSQEENKPKKTKMEAAKEAIRNVLNSMRTNKDKEAIHCNYIDEKYQNDPEYTIPRGNKKRVQGNIKRYTNRALDRNPDAKQYQKEAVAEFVRMMKAKVGSGRKKLSPEELAAARRIGEFSPANMDSEESEKYQRALEQKKYYRNLMYQAKNKKKQ